MFKENEVSEREMQAMHALNMLEQVVDAMKQKEVMDEYTDMEKDYIRELSEQLMNYSGVWNEERAYKLPGEDEVQKAFDEMFAFFNK